MSVADAAVEESADQVTGPIDACDHVWQMDLAGDHVCIRDGGCGLTLVSWPPDQPLPARGADWDRVALTRPGRLLFRRGA